MAALPLVGHAQEPVQDLSKCLADSTTGKDRKDLARWVFLAMGAHAEIKRYTSADAPAAGDESQKAVADMFTRLIADSCAKEFRATMKVNGSAGIGLAFQTLGTLAWQELMADPAVKESMTAFMKHIDQKKIAEAMSGE